MKHSQRRAFSVPEGLAVISMMSVIGFCVWMTLWGATEEDRQFALEHNLSKLRAKISEYRIDHHGLPPVNLRCLTISTDMLGHPTTGGQVGWGPYLESIPENPFSRPWYRRRSVCAIDANPAGFDDVTPGNRGGWLYNPKTGGIWADHSSYVDR